MLPRKRVELSATRSLYLRALASCWWPPSRVWSRGEPCDLSLRGVDGRRGSAAELSQLHLQTRDGYLWLTTSDGLVRYDNVRFMVFNRSNCRSWQ
jgi:hypothetical protein